jgi:hypothetical protein
MPVTAVQRKTFARHAEKTFRLLIPFRESPLRDLAKLASHRVRRQGRSPLDRGAQHVQGTLT